jgi:hypothetical protein
VHKRNGSLVAFESDKISRALFAATESLGQPDAFLARELTDGVVHFLASEHDGQTPSTSEIAELVVKVVRELGQPALAKAFAHGRSSKDQIRVKAQAEQASEFTLACAPGMSPAGFTRHCLRQYSLRHVFTRDLVAAQDDGLLILSGLAAPQELGTGLWMPTAASSSVLESIARARRITGGVLAIDGMEQLVVQHGIEISQAVRDLNTGLDATDLRAVVNLNPAAPPAWAEGQPGGPLFANAPSATDSSSLDVVADELLNLLLAQPPTNGRPPIRVDWHVAEGDLQADRQLRLLRVAHHLCAGADTAIVFDRPRRAIALADGVDRGHSAALLTIVLPLARLAERLVDQDGAAELFLKKLGSLLRLAFSAATQKREYLRAHGQDRLALLSGFLLDRARLVVAPQGLNRAMALLGESGEFATAVIARLQNVVEQDARHTHLETSFDGSLLWATGYDAMHERGIWSNLPAADGKKQLRQLAPLHAATELGAAVILVDAHKPPSAEQVVDWVRWAWKQSTIGRLRLVRVSPQHEQLTFGS